MESLIKVENLRKSFRVGEQDIEVLKGLNFEIPYEDFTIVFGPSGCGKSTLLHILLGLEEPSDGSVKYFDIELYGGSVEDQRAHFRKQHIGMVYQQPNWVKSLNVVENVAFPLWLLGRDKGTAEKKAMEQLDRVKMAGWAKYIPTELSSGQQQRVALARSLINNPEIIIADEPTGNLDYKSGQEAMSIFRDINKDSKKTVIMVTHDLEYIKYAKSVLQMLDGQILGYFAGKEKEEIQKGLQFKRGVLTNNESGENEDGLGTVETNNQTSPESKKDTNITPIEINTKQEKNKEEATNNVNKNTEPTNNEKIEEQEPMESLPESKATVEKDFGTDEVKTKEKNKKDPNLSTEEIEKNIRPAKKKKLKKAKKVKIKTKKTKESKEEEPKTEKKETKPRKKRTKKTQKVATKNAIAKMKKESPKGNKFRKTSKVSKNESVSSLI